MRTRIALVAAMVAALDVAATVEAWRSGHVALGAVTLLAGAGALTIAIRSRQPPVTLRPDLAAWAARTAAATGEAESHLLDRAVARHRDHLDGPRDTTPEERGDDLVPDRSEVPDG